MTGDDLKTEKYRKTQRDSQARRRAMDKPATAQNKKRPTKHTAWTNDRCKVCGELIWLDTHDGLLVLMEAGSRKQHRHQDGWGTK